MPEYAFVKMSGPAAHIYLNNLEFEAERNIFLSDFASIVEKFPVLATTRDQAAQTLEVCRRFLEKDCRRWVEQQQSDIVRLAAVLKSTQVMGDRYELKGQALQDAITSSANVSTNQDADHPRRINGNPSHHSMRLMRRIG